jgi:hypothetical protein
VTTNLLITSPREETMRKRELQALANDPEIQDAIATLKDWGINSAADYNKLVAAVQEGNA